MFEWMSPVVNYGSKLFSSTASAVGSAWEWGSKNPAAISAVGGAATAALNYMSQPDDPTEQSIEAQERARAAHNKSIGEAAKIYREGGMLRGGR